MHDVSQLIQFEDWRSEITLIIELNILDLNKFIGTD